MKVNDSKRWLTYCQPSLQLLRIEAAQINAFPAKFAAFLKSLVKKPLGRLGSSLILSGLSAICMIK
jgi:hypothetical protein